MKAKYELKGYELQNTCPILKTLYICMWCQGGCAACFKILPSFNPLALELGIYSLAHHLCKM
jgi:hypothetical protein